MMNLNLLGASGLVVYRGLDLLHEPKLTSNKGITTSS